MAAARRPLLAVVAVGAVFVVALVTVTAVVLARQDATDVLVPPPDPASADLRADLTLRAVDAEAGEARLRLVVTPQDDERFSGGLVTEGFRVFVNDVGGTTTSTFAAGEPLRSVDFAVALDGGSAFQYPFDDYRATVVVLATAGVEGPGEPLSLDLSVTSAVPTFHVEVTDAGEECAALGTTCVELDVRRPVPSIGYAVWLMVLVWGLAIGGLAVLAVVVRRGVELPLWSFGYLVGVLFALPPLRASLPDAPPPGGFVDFVAFYWAVVVTGVTLILLVWLWVRETRRSP